MTDEQRKRIHDITYSCDDRAELAERIVALEDELDKLKNNNNYLHETLSESRQANEHLYAELKRYKSILRTRPNAMTALYDENAKLRELVRKWYPHMLKRVGRNALEQWGQMEVVRELRIEVEE